MKSEDEGAWMCVHMRVVSGNVQVRIGVILRTKLSALSMSSPEDVPRRLFSSSFMRFVYGRLWLV